MIALADNVEGLADTGGGIAVAVGPGRVRRLGRLDSGLLHNLHPLKKRAHAREAAIVPTPQDSPDPPRRIPARAGGRPVLVEDRQAILDALGEGYTMRTAARRGGVSQRTLYVRLDQDADFAAQVAETRRFGRARRADELAEKLFEAAERCATDPRFTTACIFALKNLDPVHWRDSHEISGLGGGAIPLQVVMFGQVAEQRSLEAESDDAEAGTSARP